MLVGLHDAEMEHIKQKSFSNYALMKISAWYKQRGDTVEMFTPIDLNAAEQLTPFPLEEYPPKRKANIYDVVYFSKVFDFTPKNPYLPANTIKGGTGYNVKSKLPQEIDNTYPDYSIYPHCDYAIGYITRGCPNKCLRCYVPEKEGGIKSYRRWREIVRPDSKKLVLMDNNILVCEYGVTELESMIDSGYAIDLNQGMDARLVIAYLFMCLLQRTLTTPPAGLKSCESLTESTYTHRRSEMNQRVLFRFGRNSNSRSVMYMGAVIKKNRGANIVSGTEQILRGVTND